ncbi:MAG TPA: alpha/beta fold hydrolase [Candidatus Aquilonibacter sp.]|nr:alpha/beta fold hydrolase [Candidatus Aquilonibacter sp.]
MREWTVDLGSLRLANGALLHNVQQRVSIYGERRDDNVVLVPHALTGSSRVAEWWPGIVGDNALFDPREWCIIGINALGSCYGSTRAPDVTVADMVNAARRALDEVGVERIRFVVGGSLGGMQALQWALDDARVESAIVVGAHSHHSALGVALNAVQREAIAIDPARGLRLARKIAMLTYKSEDLFNRRHDRRPDRNDPSRFDIEGYLELAAERFAGRMDPQTYATLTQAMDRFDVRDRAVPDADVTFVGISSDWLFRPQDVRAAAKGFGARYIEMRSDHGHDAFLAESTELADLLRPVVAAQPQPGSARHA